MTEKLPKQVQQIINKYFNLPLDSKKVPCPYYINIKKHKQRMGLRVLVGKGTPEEIIQESLIYEKLRDVDFSKMTISEIRDFLVKRHIGIDCSGFVVHVLDHWLRSHNKKHLWNYIRFPKQNLYRIFARIFRPVENISATILTNEENTVQVKSLNNIKCGDLIRLKVPRRAKDLLDSYHVMLISEIKKENGKVISFKYIHSTREYGSEHGVREGKTIIKNPKAHLSKQEWTDEVSGKNWTLDEILADRNYSQVRRLKNAPLY
ncbi:hypothetical protein ACFLY9_00455 [Patescibacteria group bacterium]